MATRHPLLAILLFYVLHSEPVKSIDQVSQQTSNVSTSTQPPFVGYVSEPDGRGTASLVISCLLTLVLCVWSALHLNVPLPSETRRQSAFVNLRWIITGIYAPELVVFTAWRQWSSARLLSKIVDEQRHDQETAIPYEWTMTHSFFACSGGFAFDAADCKPFLPAECPRRLTLTARGMALLARCGHLPNIPRADILDKSKANELAKALVMVQASWMLIQVLGRLIAQLPVTVLEVNTIAHVLCAFFMYGMWWYKPLSPNEAIVLKGPWVAPLCAYIYMLSEISGEIEEGSLESQNMVKTMFASLHLYTKTPEIGSLAFLHSSENHGFEPRSQLIRASPMNSTCDLPDITASSSSETISREADRFPRLRVASRPSLEELKDLGSEKTSATAFFERRPRVLGAAQGYRSQFFVSLWRHRLASTAIEQYPVLLEQHLAHTHRDTSCSHLQSEELLAFKIQNWPWDDLLRDVGGLVVGLILWPANFAYGSIHAAAWNDHFPTTTEKSLWRSSSVYISFCGGLWIVLNYTAKAYRPLNEFWERWMDGDGRGWQHFLLGTPVVVCGFSLLFARAFIVIEAFLSIRSLPAAAYVTPRWSQILPHF